jgi:hypothetical protein
VNPNFKVAGLPTFINGLARFKMRFQGDAVAAAAVYLVGNESRGLTHEPAYKYVTRKSAYGQTFSSAKQRRYVMAMIRSGEITPGKEKRTHAIQRGWRILYSGLGARIRNDAPGVGWVMGTQQARQPAKVGWRAFDKVASDNRDGMSRASSQAVQRAMRETMARH